MPAIVVKAFGGMRPLVEPYLLEPSEAQLAENARLISGAISPLRATTVLQALRTSAPQTIWRFGDSSTETEWWLEFSTRVDVIRSPIPSDPYARTYWSTGGTARYAPSSLLLSGGGAFPGGSFVLGIPAPASQPNVSGTPLSTSSAETRSYVYTYVSEYGEEGPPSAPSAPLQLDPGQPVTISAMSTGPSGAYSITKKRIYRTSTVGSSAQFQFVAEILVGGSSYVDTVSQANLGETLQTAEWVGPPSGLTGLKMLANGAAIGFVGNTVYTSEPNLPHAWPNSTTIEDQIVGIGVFRQGAALLTNKHPYLYTGADPAAMTPERLERPMACVSRQSIVDTGDGCLYASTEGLVSVGPGGAEIITKKLISPDQWRAYNPPSMFAAVLEGRYHCFYTKTNGDRGVLIFDFEGGGATLTTCTINASTPVTALYADPGTGTLYMARGTSIERFDRGSSLTARWVSGVYRLPNPANMSCAAVDASAYPVSLKVFADGNLVRQLSVPNGYAFRLPAGFEAANWSFELSGAVDKITRVVLATSMSELKAAQ